MELCRRFCTKKYGPIFGVKLNLHSSKTVKDFGTKFYQDIHFANVGKKKKTRGLYRVLERRYLNFNDRTFLKILVIHTAPTVKPTRTNCTVDAVTIVYSAYQYLKGKGT